MVLGDVVMVNGVRVCLAACKLLIQYPPLSTQMRHTITSPCAMMSLGQVHPGYIGPKPKNIVQV